MVNCVTPGSGDCVNPQCLANWVRCLKAPRLRIDIPSMTVCGTEPLTHGVSWCHSTVLGLNQRREHYFVSKELDNWFLIWKKCYTFNVKSVVSREKENSFFPLVIPFSNPSSALAKPKPCYVYCVMSCPATHNLVSLAVPRSLQMSLVYCSLISHELGLKYGPVSWHESLPLVLKKKEQKQKQSLQDIIMHVGSFLPLCVAWATDQLAHTQLGVLRTCSCWKPSVMVRVIHFIGLRMSRRLKKLPSGCVCEGISKGH